MRQAKLTLLFTLLMSMVCIEATASFGVANSDGVTIYYEIINDGEVSVSKPNYVKYYGSVVIPETVTYDGKTYKVTTIDVEAFSYCYGLTSINIPSSVTRIEDGAFRECTGLMRIVIPNSVTYIGYATFEGCSGLTSINIPNSVTTIGESAFEGCI